MPAPGPWIADWRLRDLAAAGLTYRQIADVNGQATGWQPTVPGVSRKLARLGVPPRNASHRDLIPWKIRPEHAHQVQRYMLQAESRRRQGLPLSGPDRYLAGKLRRVLRGSRGTRWVIGYDPAGGGFYYATRTPADDDIIRRPPAQGAPAFQPVADVWPDGAFGVTRGHMEGAPMS